MTTFTINDPKFLVKLAVLKKFANLAEERKYTLLVGDGSARLLAYSFNNIKQQLSIRLCDVDQSDTSYEMSLTNRDIKKLNAIDWSGPVDCMIMINGFKPSLTLTTRDTETGNGSRLVLVSENDNEPYSMDDSVSSAATAATSEGQIIANADELRTVALRTAVTLSHDDTRNNIQCAHVEQEDDTLLKAISTDGHRLTMQTFGADKEHPLPFSINIPGPVWSTLVNALSLAKGLEQVRFDYEKRQHTETWHKGLKDERTDVMNYMMMWTTIGSFEFRFETSPDKYPDFRRVLPKAEHCVTIDFDMIAFRSLLAKHKHTVHSKTQGFTMEIQPNRIVLKSKCDDSTFTNSIELLNPSPFGDTSVSVGFSLKYMMDALAGNPNGMMAFQIHRKDAMQAPVAISHFGGLRTSIVMPMRV